MIHKFLHSLHNLVFRLYRSAKAMQKEATQKNTYQLKLTHTPFPLKDPQDRANFFNVSVNGRLGHSNRSGEIYWEDTTYSDNRVLVSIPPHFNENKDAYILLYLHGNQATLTQDVRDRQRIPQQLNESGLNAILIAPQFALDALDSSAGNFNEVGFVKAFLAESAKKISEKEQQAELEKILTHAKVVLVAYSGGYKPAAMALKSGEIMDRLAGVILLDALYDHQDIFAQFIAEQISPSTNTPRFFISGFTESCRSENKLLLQLIKDKNIEYRTELPNTFQSTIVCFIDTQAPINHYSFASHAWVKHPLADILKRVAIHSTI